MSGPVDLPLYSGLIVHFHFVKESFSLCLKDSKPLKLIHHSLDHFGFIHYLDGSSSFCYKFVRVIECEKVFLL